ncbi:MAG: efflux RND transporter periplasmic adaptor subunit [Marinifilaceae bacterium]
MRGYYLLILSISGLIQSGCRETPNVIKKEQESKPTVHTVTARNKQISNDVVLPGKVITDPDRTVHYTSLCSGVVVKTYFALGDKVEKGQVMLEFKSSELSAMQAELVALESDFTVARREETMYSDMLKDGIISEKEMLESVSRVKQLQAMIHKIKSDMSVYGNSTGNGVFSIQAPMSGYVIGRNATVGSTITTESEALFTVANLDVVWVIANVYAANMQHVVPGCEAEITSVSYPGRTFNGHVNHVSHVFHAEDRTLKARIVMDNKELALKPEMNVAVRVNNRECNKHMASVPTDALIFDNNRYYVVVREEDAFKVREVTPHATSNNYTYLATGIHQGEEVVVKNQLLIYSGLKEI